MASPCPLEAPRRREPHGALEATQHAGQETLGNWVPRDDLNRVPGSRVSMILLPLKSLQEVGPSGASAWVFENYTGLVNAHDKKRDTSHTLEIIWEIEFKQ